MENLLLPEGIDDHTEGVEGVLRALDNDGGGRNRAGDSVPEALLRLSRTCWATPPYERAGLPLLMYRSLWKTGEAGETKEQPKRKPKKKKQTATD